jgi:hypothetical protein
MCSSTYIVLFLAFVGVDNLETMPMQTLEIEEAMTSFQNEPEPAIPTEESPPPEILREKTLRLDDFAQVLLVAFDCVLWFSKICIMCMSMEPVEILLHSNWHHHTIGIATAG